VSEPMLAREMANFCLASKVLNSLTAAGLWARIFTSHPNAPDFLALNRTRSNSVWGKMPTRYQFSSDMRLLTTLRLRYFQRAIRRGGRDGETRRRGDGERGRGGERERGRKSTILIL